LRDRLKAMIGFATSRYMTTKIEHGSGKAAP
jgi:hypothetical protein